MQYKVLPTNLMWSSKDIGLAIQLWKSNNQGLIKLSSGVPITNNQVGFQHGKLNRSCSLQHK
jgi:hypothetical protein